ncbi:uncharacterized protein FA14DRAFT_156243 [Meira miltonrushii]|uniref:Uncharacterized protein n=1 Tax=Meira miltonrushii TaxID=1280837 RepID=A0A316V7W5_9BASI|nr:uncharacterized protein FA14DRAFT_156243 [Meira miltonrushii]PWN33552.1 hypothetical protein FA14DRAFT_156243 [Meira miltonrushii]
MTNSTKTPFPWNLNEPGSPNEHEEPQSPEASRTSRRTDEAETVRAFERSNVKYARRRRRNQIDPADDQCEGESWNKTEIRKKNMPTAAQRDLYNQRKREKYAAMNKDKKKSYITKMREQKELRFAKLNPQEQEAFIARRRFLENKRKLRKRLSRTDEQKLKDKELLILILSWAVQAVNESNKQKPTLPFDLNEEPPLDDQPVSSPQSASKDVESRAEGSTGVKPVRGEDDSTERRKHARRLFKQEHPDAAAEHLAKRRKVYQGLSVEKKKSQNKRIMQNFSIRMGKKNKAELQKYRNKRAEQFRVRYAKKKLEMSKEEHEAIQEKRRKAYQKYINAKKKKQE